MFNEVKILDSNNHIKKIIPNKELSRRHWEMFEKDEVQRFLPQLKKKKNQNN